MLTPEQITKIVADRTKFPVAATDLPFDRTENLEELALDPAAPPVYLVVRGALE